MKQLYKSVIMLLLTLVACNNEQREPLTSSEIIIYGNSINENKTEGRSTTRTLEEGATISFYASGGITSNGRLLTYMNSIWEGDSPFYWQTTSPATICAYNPPLPLNSSSLYNENGHLSDILIAQQSYSFGENIYLHFEHLFSQIQFNVEKELNQQLKKCIIATQQHITQIDPYKGIISAEVGQEEKATVFEPNSSGIYKLLLPPGENQSIAINIQTQDGRTFKKTLSQLNLQRNHSYVFGVKRQEQSIGIETADDYIAFTKLINGMACKGRSLSEFGITKEGQTTYYLNKDIQFTDAQKQEIHQIGLHGFKDVFDGRGHTLINISFLEEKAMNVGIFSEIMQGGVVKDLHIRNCNNNSAMKSGYAGILCGKNSGTILNCSITGCRLGTAKNYLGGLVGLNGGTIANCTVDRLTVSVHPNAAIDCHIDFGGITYSNGTHGKILNCNTMRLMKKGNFKYYSLACICPSNGNILSNCLTDQIPTIFYPFCRRCQSPCDHCYYPEDLREMALKTSGMSEKQQISHHVTSFNSSVESRQDIVNKLNNWIETTGHQSYPEVSFSRWKLNPDNTIGFEN